MLKNTYLQYCLKAWFLKVYNGLVLQFYLVYLLSIKYMRISALLLALVFLIAGCKKDEPKTTGTLTVEFVGTANNQPFVLGNTVTTVDGLPCRYENFKFYVSDMRLYHNGTADTILDAALINYNNVNPYKSVSIELPAGSYDGFGFGVGVDSLQNKVDPTNYPSTSPFSSVNGMYWGMGFMYRFMILEGYSDTTDDGIDNFVCPISIHTGNNALYKNVNFNSFPIVISAGNETKVKVNFDFNHMFYSPTDTIDLRTDNITHTSDNHALAAKVATNFANSLNASN